MHQGRWIGKGLELCGFGHYFARRRVENSAVSGISTTPDEVKVLGRTGGVTAHHVADDTEDVGYMAAQAAREACRAAGLDPKDVDLLILSNWTDRWCAPEWAPLIAMQIGADKALAFDICQGCAGFVHGVHTAAMYLSAGDYQHAVVIGSERFSRRVRPGSTGELVVSDAAGAAVLSRNGRDGLIDSVMHTTGTLAHTTTVDPRTGWVRSQRQLNDLAVIAIADAFQEILERNDLGHDEVDWLIPHAATEPFQEGLRQRLAFPPAKILSNFFTRGNTSSASIPSTLSEALETGRAHRGELIASPSLGGGVWSYGCLLYRILPDETTRD
ncbi:MAG: ketoacyl-ACP synthase III [Propionibacterium acidifaciens]|uniref:ketoacyl-ACP synthase III n=1 Tax=Propionibacterium acidifaciens TaxID=556499 RepID=UPI00048AF273|nr:ketoacyl-ACP synthase III [Propionibacterium acidifaciens]